MKPYYFVYNCCLSSYAFIELKSKNCFAENCFGLSFNADLADANMDLADLADSMDPPDLADWTD